MPTRDTTITDTADELRDCALQGVEAVDCGKPQDACPYGWDTAQGIIWLQAWRLTTDRLTEATEETCDECGAHLDGPHEPGCPKWDTF